MRSEINTSLAPLFNVLEREHHDVRDRAVTGEVTLQSSHPDVEALTYQRPCPQVTVQHFLQGVGGHLRPFRFSIRSMAKRMTSSSRQCSGIGDPRDLHSERIRLAYSLG